MKILMTLTLAMLVSASVYAECKKDGDTCTQEECSKLGTDFAFKAEEKKCVKIVVSAETQCAGIVGTSGNKQVGADGKATTGTTSQNSGK